MAGKGKRRGNIADRPAMAELGGGLLVFQGTPLQIKLIVNNIGYEGTVKSFTLLRDIDVAS